MPAVDFGATGAAIAQRPHNGRRWSPRVYDRNIDASFATSSEYSSKGFAGAEVTRLTTVVTKKFTHKAKKPAANCENGSIVKLKTTA
jgi:hypothetical protein